MREYVTRALKDMPPEEARVFLGEIRVNWRDAIARVRRTTLLMALLFVLFVLLLDARVSTVALAGVKLRPEATDLVAVALPALGAFLFVQYLELEMLIDRYRAVHNEMYSQLHPSLLPLDKALHPPETNTMEVLDLYTPFSPERGSLLMVITGMVISLVKGLLPFAFVGAAYAALLAASSAPLVATLASMFVAFFFLVRAAGVIRFENAVLRV